MSTPLNEKVIDLREMRMERELDRLQADVESFRVVLAGAGELLEEHRAPREALLMIDEIDDVARQAGAMLKKNRVLLVEWDQLQARLAYLVSRWRQIGVALDRHEPDGPPPFLNAAYMEEQHGRLVRRLRDFLNLVERENDLGRWVEDTLFSKRSRREVAHRLREATPAQKVAPAQFEIRDGKLRILHQPAIAAADAASGAESALVMLVEKGKRLIEALRGSNSDRRLAEAAVDVNERLESRLDVVQLGIANIGLTMMTSAFEEELSAANLAILRAYTAGVNMYLAQFEDWVRFAENAAAMEFGPEDVAQVRDLGMRMAERFAAEHDKVDPEVPRTIAFLIEMIGDPKKAATRATFAAIRTIENVVSAIVTFGTDLLESVGPGVTDGAKTGVSKAVEKIVFAALLAIAIEGAIGLTPLASKMGGISWVQPTVEMLKREASKMGIGE